MTNSSNVDNNNKVEGAREGEGEVRVLRAGNEEELNQCKSNSSAVSGVETCLSSSPMMISNPPSPVHNQYVSSSGGSSSGQVVVGPVMPQLGAVSSGSGYNVATTNGQLVHGHPHSHPHPHPAVVITDYQRAGLGYTPVNIPMSVPLPLQVPLPVPMPMPMPVSIPMPVQIPLPVSVPVSIPPLYNGVNSSYPGLRLLHSTPPVYAVDNFLSAAQCHFLIHIASDSFVPAPVVGKGAGEISASRTSSACYLAREDVTPLMGRVCSLTGKPLEHCELPQIGRYLPTQRFMQHHDAFDVATEDGRRFASNGGQRTVTVLIYLNDVREGGSTSFPTLGLKVQPKQGMAIVFFPATVDGVLDRLALHEAEPAVDVKYVSQVWIRQGVYQGRPSKRLGADSQMPLA